MCWGITSCTWNSDSIKGVHTKGVNILILVYCWCVKTCCWCISFLKKHPYHHGVTWGWGDHGCIDLKDSCSPHPQPDSVLLHLGWYYSAWTCFQQSSCSYPRTYLPATCRGKIKISGLNSTQMVLLSQIHKVLFLNYNFLKEIGTFFPA